MPREFVDARHGDCPWGCGLPLRHGHDNRCPPTYRNPKTGETEWANGPYVAIGTSRQLEDDLIKLEELRTAAVGCTECRSVLHARMRLIDSELKRREAAA